MLLLESENTISHPLRIGIEQKKPKSHKKFYLNYYYFFAEIYKILKIGSTFRVEYIPA